jgi:signal transduction histidine kinase
MQQLIEDLLQVSRLSRRPNELQVVNLNDVLREVQERFEYVMAEKQAQLCIPEPLPTFACDRVRIGEVFANLISNAIKYADKPQPRIELRCHLREDGYYQFSVADNGPGIEPQYFEKIFEIFQRLGKKEEQEGTGVGLTIVKKIVELHNGRVWVESAVGQGTTFYFTVIKDEQVLLGKKKLGEILVEKGIVSQQELEEALDAQQRGKEMIAREETARREERDG